MLVDQRQDVKAPAIVGLGLHEVEAPDVIAVDWAQPNARTVVQPKSAAWSMPLRDLEPLATPDALNPVLAHLPAVCLQQRGDAAVAVAPVLGRQGDDGLGQCILIGRHGRHGALRAAVLTDDPAGVTFRETVRPPDADHCLPASLGGYKVPEATSANT